jgi:hypothetical protein
VTEDDTNDDPVVCTRCGEVYPPDTPLHSVGVGDICDRCWWEEMADEEDR